MRPRPIKDQTPQRSAARAWDEETIDEAVKDRRSGVHSELKHSGPT